LTGYVDGKTTGASPAWSHIPAAKVTDLKQRNTDWHTAYAKTLGPHTSVDMEAKNDARHVAEAFARQFVAQYLKFDPITNEDRTAMNLHNRDTTHTTIGKPTIWAVMPFPTV
jgi:arylamine N-acetyltransferase